MRSWLQVTILTTIFKMHYVCAGWADTEEDMNLFYDRIVKINFGKLSTSGVLIDNERVLTSFNPFRVLSRSAPIKEKIMVLPLVKRKVLNGRIRTYVVYPLKIAKARQIVPLAENDLDENLWHGKDKLHSPVHDLMIILTDETVTLRNQSEVTKPEDLFISEVDVIEEKLAGPIKSEIADNDTFLGRDIEYAGCGLLNRNKDVITHSYDEEDNVVLNCNEWLPKDWGHFICINNLDGFKGVSSGAVLFSNKIVHGIGSFALSKGNRSILVFTDVKPYHTLIFNTFKDDGRRSDASFASGPEILKMDIHREPRKRLGKKTKDTSW